MNVNYNANIRLILVIDIEGAKTRRSNRYSKKAILRCRLLEYRRNLLT
jgi:hypothetical protein